MDDTGLTEFKNVLTDFGQLNSVALKGAVVLPLADIWLKLGPPPSKAIGGLTALAEFLAVVCVFQFWSRMQDGKLRTRMKISHSLFLVGMASSLLLLSRFSVSPGQDREKVIEGYSLRSDIRPLINDSYPAEQALRDSEYDAEKVWTKGSIAILHLLIIVAWTGTFACFAIYLTTFIVLQRRFRPKANRAGNA